MNIHCLIIVIFCSVSFRRVTSSDDLSENQRQSSGVIQLCGFRDSGGEDNWVYPRIVGGSKARKDEFKWQISIKRRNRHICGGAIIGRSWVITAAHCVYYFRPSDLTFVAGEYQMNKNEGTEQVRRAQFFIKHEKYNGRTQENDIALVKITRPFDFSTLKVAPVCLPNFRQTFSGSCVVTGWGKTGEYGARATILQKVWLPLMNDSECQEKYDQLGYKNTISNSMICAGLDEGKKDACQGDSGGPLVCPGNQNLPMLTGLVSWGVGCARPNTPGVYTEVSHYVPWINEKVTNFSVKTKKQSGEKNREEEKHLRNSSTTYSEAIQNGHYSNIRPSFQLTIHNLTRLDNDQFDSDEKVEVTSHEYSSRAVHSSSSEEQASLY